MFPLFLLCLCLEAEAIWPFTSSSSSGTQRIPQSFSGFVGNIPNVNHFDIEAITKNAAIRTNQDSAMMSQLGQMVAAKRVPTTGEAEILSTNVDVMMPRNGGGSLLRSTSGPEFESDELRNLLQANAFGQQSRNLQMAKLSNPLLLGGLGGSQLPLQSNGADFIQLQRDFLLQQQLSNGMLPNSGSRFPFSDPRPLNPVPFLGTRKLTPIIPQTKSFVRDIESDHEFSSFEPVRRPLQQPRPVRVRNDAFSENYDLDSEFGRNENRGIVDSISDGFGSRVPRSKLF
ncbi:hypothetical protein L596_007653 [Steinernema carpocapsae]|uniref:Uncharacterized protein n=1 Tax=Steinernema carpocapsae TaxID=34508 RepID=A0A4U5PA59_STECR|nr:hypothetical protein L596_007653 [Steinernema carpocapsae]